MDANSTDQSPMQPSMPTEQPLSLNGSSEAVWNGSNAGEGDMPVRLLLNGKTPPSFSALLPSNGTTTATAQSQGGWHSPTHTI